MSDQTSSESAGAESLSARAVPLIGGRVFWVYGGALPAGSGAGPETFKATFSTLEEKFDPRGDAPIGLCVPVDPAEAASHPEAIWGDTELLYAGYLRDGRQARIRYFDEAAIGPGLPNSPTLAETRRQSYPLEDRHRMESLRDSDVTHEEVLALWAREGAVPDETEAKRRVHEVHLVATDREDGLVGISSAYLQRNAQLRMELWYYRAFVAKAHRMSSLAGALAVRGREVLEERFVSGEDTRAGGIIYEVENPGLKQYFNKALWLPTDFIFIGENERGHHVRVHYFPGAEAPPPSA